MHILQFLSILSVLLYIYPSGINTHKMPDENAGTANQEVNQEEDHEEDHEEDPEEDPPMYSFMYFTTDGPISRFL